MARRRKRASAKKELSIIELLVKGSFAAPWWFNLALGITCFVFWKWGIDRFIDNVFFAPVATMFSMIGMVFCTLVGIYQYIEQPGQNHRTTVSTPRKNSFPGSTPSAEKAGVEKRSEPQAGNTSTKRANDDRVSRACNELSAQHYQDYLDGVSRAGSPPAIEGPASPPPAPIFNKSNAEALMDKGRVYVPHGLFFTPSERVAYAELVKTHAESAIVFSKVRVVDVIKPDTFKHPKWTKNFTTLFRQLSQWHLDFVIVDSASMKVIRAIELDDPTHFRPDRVRRDRILNAAFANAGVPLDRMHLRAGKLHLLHQQQRKAGTTLENGVRHW